MKFLEEMEKAIQNSLLEDSHEKSKEHTRIVDSFDGNLYSKILGWKFDKGSNSIMIKRDYGRCMYYYHTEDILNLPKSDLHQLAKLKMVNIGKYPHGYELEDFLKKQVKKDFADCNVKKIQEKINYFF